MNLPYPAADEIVGSGYLGWALVVEFCSKHEPIETNLSESKIDAYSRHLDSFGEVAVEDPKMALRESGLEPNHIPAPYRQRRLSPLITMGVGECVTIRKLAEHAQCVVGFAGRLLFDQSDGTHHKVTDVLRVQVMRRHAKTGLGKGGQLTWQQPMFEK